LLTFVVLLIFPGWKNPGAVDGTGSDHLSEVHIGIRRLELRRGRLGGDLVWREALLELDQPGRYQGNRQGLQTSTTDGK